MELSKNAQKIMDLVKDMSAVELNQLVKALEEEFGVSAAAMVVAGAAWWAAWGDAWSAAGSDTVNVELTDVWQQKIAVIKVVKETLNLSLKDAKDLVEKSPTIVKEKVKMEEAEALKTKLQEVWATVSFK